MDTLRSGAGAISAECERVADKWSGQEYSSHGQSKSAKDTSISLLSDNCSRACEEVMRQMLDENIESETPYGNDRASLELTTRMSELFDHACDVFVVSTGVAANAVAIASMMRPYESVICSKSAHIYRDECGAVSFFSGGGGLIPMPTTDGKLRCSQIDQAIEARNDIHFQRAGVVSFTQATELGTIYSGSELGWLIQKCKSYDMRVHVDGARLANAAATLGCKHIREIAAFGADIVTFGAIKNGGAIGEAIVVLNPSLADGVGRRLKQSGHLVSKVRYLSAGWLGLLKNDVWLRNAERANLMARRLASRVAELPKLQLVYPVEANSVFLGGSPELVARLRAQLPCKTYPFIGPEALRLTCSWNTTKELVDQVAASIAEITAHA